MFAAETWGTGCDPELDEDPFSADDEDDDGEDHRSIDTSASNVAPSTSQATLPASSPIVIDGK